MLDLYKSTKSEYQIAIFTMRHFFFVLVPSLNLWIICVFLYHFERFESSCMFRWEWRDFKLLVHFTRFALCVCVCVFFVIYLILFFVCLEIEITLAYASNKMTFRINEYQLQIDEMIIIVEMDICFYSFSWISFFFCLKNLMTETL